jgi:integrase
LARAPWQALGRGSRRFDPAHSLRWSLATAAAKAGKSEWSIMKQTGHRSVTVVRHYIRDAELFDDNAAAGIGL